MANPPEGVRPGDKKGPSGDFICRRKVHIRCRLGLHSWYLESAMFSGALVCSLCGKYQDENDQRALEAEQAAWANGTLEYNPYGHRDD